MSRQTNPERYLGQLDSRKPRKAPNRAAELTVEGLRPSPWKKKIDPFLAVLSVSANPGTTENGVGVAWPHALPLDATPDRMHASLRVLGSIDPGYSPAGALGNR